MKMPAETYDVLEKAITKLVEQNGPAEEIVEQYKSRGLTETRMLFDILYAVTFDIQYDDSHPAFQQGRVRRFDHVPNFDLYTGGCNDDHVLTALRAICKKLGVRY